VSDKHFTLDIDPDGLRSVATKLSTLKSHIETKAGTVKGTPGDIGDSWTGDAATSIKSEMTGLGKTMDRYGDKLQPAIEKLRSLARDYDDALERLPELNRKWEQAETDYQDALDANQAKVERTRREWREQGMTINMTLNHELDEMRNSGASAAFEAKRTTQHNLEIDFGYMKMYLAQQTRGLSTTLADAVPVKIDPDALDKWRSGESDTNPLAGLLGEMDLTKQIDDKAHADALQELKEQAEEDVEALQDALEDGDTEAIEKALDEIGENADNAGYARELVRKLGADGVHDVYSQIDDMVRQNELVTEELWPHLKGFNDAVAHGMEHMGGEEFASFMEQMNDNDYFQRELALIAASDYAKGKVSAAAMAYFSQVYISDPSSTMGRTLFPEVFHYAYGENDIHMMEEWDAKADGSDLAEFFQHMDEGDQRDLLDHMLVFSHGPTDSVGDEDWEKIAKLYGETVQAVRDQGNAGIGQEGARFPSDTMELLLSYVNAPNNSMYSDDYKGYVEDVVKDPKFLTWYIRDVIDDGAGPRELNDAIKFVDGNADDLMESIIEYQVSTGVNEAEIAEFIGYMLRTDELLGDKIKLGGVLKSLVESGISAGVKHPATGPVLGVFNALLAEYERMEGNIQAWEDAMGDNELHNQLGFALYVRIYGQPPEFEQWLEKHGREDDEDAMVDFLQEQKTQGTDLYNDINNLVDIIDESRDEE
jgi:WXG100 family type VII secretion target